jgi:hypothetical protein
MIKNRDDNDDGSDKNLDQNKYKWELLFSEISCSLLSNKYAIDHKEYD